MILFNLPKMIKKIDRTHSLPDELVFIIKQKLIYSHCLKSRDLLRSLYGGPGGPGIFKHTKLKRGPNQGLTASRGRILSSRNHVENDGEAVLTRAAAHRLTVGATSRG